MKEKLKIVLASSSKYRAMQLKALGLKFETESPGLDESAIKKLDLKPEEKCKRLAEEKGKIIAAKYPNAIVAAGDQMGLLDNELLGKPGTTEKCLEQLRKLQGRSHYLLSSLAVFHQNQMTSVVIKNELVMRKINDDQLQRYIELENPVDCAGSYKIESAGLSLFEQIKSPDFSSIMGLPMLSLTKFLDEYGFEFYES